MSYPVHVYVGPTGEWAGASRRPDNSVSIGLWWPSQFDYQPFKAAVEDGRVEASTALAAGNRLRGKYTQKQWEHTTITAPRGTPANPMTIAAMRLHLVEGLTISDAVRITGAHRRNVQRMIKSLYKRMEEFNAV